MAPLNHASEQFFSDEFCTGSGIDLALYRATTSVHDDLEIVNREPITPLHDALNWKYTRFGQQANESFSGIVLRNEDDSTWQVKLDKPRIDKDKTAKTLRSALKLPEWAVAPDFWQLVKQHPGLVKYRKYETPVGNGSRAFLPVVPPNIRRQISERYGIDIPEVDSFWAWLEQHPEIPITLTEGGKKALALFSQGYVAIGLYGVNGGYLRTDNGRELIADLARFTSGSERRTWVLAFDQDEDPKTRRRVRTALITFGCVLSWAKGEVSVAEWLPEQGKGADDVIVQSGADVIHDAIADAEHFSLWSVSHLRRLTYKVNDRPALGQKFISLENMPADAKLVGVKAPKGTGKTEALISIVDRATQQGQRVILLTHRVQLGQAICDRVGLPYVTEIRSSDEGSLFGYGVCMDSLHPQSQARFNAEEWRDALVLIDEAEQVLWHTFNAQTDVKKHRVTVIRQLRQLLQNTLQGFGQVILLDADLTDVAIDCVKQLGGVPDLQPWIYRSNWQPEVDQRCTTHTFDENTPEAWEKALYRHVEAGGRALVCLSAQKVNSRWGTQRLEARLKQKFPELRILRIDSEASSNPQHAAYGSVSKLNEVLPQYDIVLCSPTIETGVSITIRNHFTSVWGLFQGNLPTDSVRQFLARLRQNVDRYIWAAKTGMNQSRIAGGSTSANLILEQEHKLTRCHIQQLTEGGYDLGEGVVNVDDGALVTWAKMAARINAGFVRYRDAIYQGLQSEGHQLESYDVPEDKEELKEFRAEIKAEKKAAYEASCTEIATAQTISDAEAEALDRKKAKTIAEAQQLRKHQLERRYCIEITPELVAQDDKGIHSQLRTLYFLTEGAEFAAEQDFKAIERAATNGEIWIPDFNRKPIATKVRTLEALSIRVLMDPERQWSVNDAELNAIATKAKAEKAIIKKALGIAIRETDTPIPIAQALLGKVGLKLECVGRPKVDGKAGPRIYQLAGIEDKRAAIFVAWHERDLQRREENQRLFVKPSKTAHLSETDPPLVIRNIDTSGSTLLIQHPPQDTPASGTSTIHKDGSDLKAAQQLFVSNSNSWFSTDLLEQWITALKSCSSWSAVKWITSVLTPKEKQGLWDLLGQDHPVRHHVKRLRLEAGSSS